MMAAEGAGVGLVAYEDRDSASDSEEEYVVPRKKTRVDNSGAGRFHLKRIILTCKLAS